MGRTFPKVFFIFLRMEQVNNKYKDLALITYKSAVLAALRVHIFLQEKLYKIVITTREHLELALLLFFYGGGGRGEY